MGKPGGHAEMARQSLKDRWGQQSDTHRCANNEKDYVTSLTVNFYRMPDNALVLLPIWDILNGTPLTLCFQGVRPARNIIIVVYSFEVVDFVSITMTILEKMGFKKQ